MWNFRSFLGEVSLLRCARNRMVRRIPADGREKPSQDTAKIWQVGLFLHYPLSCLFPMYRFQTVLHQNPVRLGEMAAAEEASVGRQR